MWATRCEGVKMNIYVARISSIAILFCLTGCGLLPSSKITEDWDYATSTAVLGLSPQDLEMRLGPAIVKQVSEIGYYGDLTFPIGDCQVSYTTVEGKVAMVRIKLDQPCQPSFKGVPILEGFKLDSNAKFSAVPSALTGTWRANCLGASCFNTSSRIEFIHPGNGGERPLQIALSTMIDTKEEQAFSAAWARAIIGRSDIYSPQLDLKAICGTADQAVATSILRDLTMEWVSFGYELDEAKRAGCAENPNPTVSISGEANELKRDVRSAQTETATASAASSITQEAGQDAASESHQDEPVPPSAIGGARDGMIYVEVRKRIIAAGYQPVPRPAGQFCGYAEACSLPETDACAGAGTGQCSYYFQKAGQRIEVLGMGEVEGQPQGQTVYSVRYSN